MKKSKSSEKRERMEHLKKRLHEMETDNRFGCAEAINKYLSYLKLTEEQKKTLSQEWNKYYSAVLESPVAKNAFAVRDALILGDMGQVKELTSKSIEHTLNKPSSIDPEELIHGQFVQSYIHIKKLIDEMLYESRSLEEIQTRKVFYNDD